MTKLRIWSLPRHAFIHVEPAPLDHRTGRGKAVRNGARPRLAQKDVAPCPLLCQILLTLWIVLYSAFATRGGQAYGSQGPGGATSGSCYRPRGA
jgi:hypothetical protein